jgi:hypothetical protein
MTLLLGLAALVLLWWASKTFVKSDTKAVARALKVVGGVLSLGAAVIIGAKGRIDMAFLVGGLGAWLLGWSASAPGFLRNLGLGQSRTSRVRSALVELEMDHRSGRLRGLVLAGTFNGFRLDDLDAEQLQRLYAECRNVDRDGVPLLEAYLDRRFPAWREHAQAHGDTGTRGQAHAGAMTKEEAYEVLGLKPGASLDDIQRTYRALMKRLHPDQGGTTYLATRVNQAKEVLLSRHR